MKKNRNTITCMDDLSLKKIASYVDSCFLKQVQLYPQLRSTNETAKQLALQGACHGTVVIADMQTGGKGRYDRSFYSPPHSGLYLSVILRNQGISQYGLLTAAAGVVVCHAIEQWTQKKTWIKWVNDIFVDQKKVCGILTEGGMNAQTNALDWAILGIGINVYPSELPDFLKPVVGFLTDGQMTTGHSPPLRNQLAGTIIQRLLQDDQWMERNFFYNEYKNRMFLLKKRVMVTQGTQQYPAIILDLDPDCQLILQKEGSIEESEIVTLSSGEISITATSNP